MSQEHEEPTAFLKVFCSVDLNPIIVEHLPLVDVLQVAPYLNRTTKSSASARIDHINKKLVVFESDVIQIGPYKDQLLERWPKNALVDVFQGLLRRWIPYGPERWWSYQWYNAFGIDYKKAAIDHVDQMHKQHKYTIGCLHMMMTNRCMIREGTDEGKVTHDNFNKIIKIVTGTATQVLQRVEMHAVVSWDELDLDNTFDAPDHERLCAVYQVVLKAMKEKCVRRLGDDIYTLKGPQPVKVQWKLNACDEEIYTKLSTIEEFVYDTVRKQFNFKMYRYMRSSANYAQVVISWLTKSEELIFGS